MPRFLRLTMSRIGKNPVRIPSGVEVSISGQTLTAKGRLGALSLKVDSEVNASVTDGTVAIAPNSDTKQSRAMWGTTRALVDNMVTGVSEGFSVNLEITGVGIVHRFRTTRSISSSAIVMISGSSSPATSGSVARGRPPSPSAEPTVSASVKSRPTSVPIGHPNRTKAKALNTPMRVFAGRKGKRSNV